VANPSVHYIGSNVGTLRDHSRCQAVWDGIVRGHSGYNPPPAYNFGVCNDHAQFFEGRGWNMDSAANGVDEDPEIENLGSRALLVLVGPDDQISDQCKRAVAGWAESAVFDHGMSWPLRPHSNYVATSCPGDNLRQLVNEINDGMWRGTPPVQKKDEEDVALIKPKAADRPDIYITNWQTKRALTPAEFDVHKFFGGVVLELDPPLVDSIPLVADGNIAQWEQDTRKVILAELTDDDNKE
jgi:hypothetical protein